MGKIKLPTRLLLGTIGIVAIWAFVGLGVTTAVSSIPLTEELLLEEIVELRDRSSKTYDLGDNKYALDATIGSVHYQDEFGDWQEIDNQWSAAQAPWDWEMLEDEYHTSVLEDFTAGQILLFESQGEQVAFQPMALEWTNDIDQISQISMPQYVTANVSNEAVELLPGMEGSISKIRWDDAYGTGRHFEWKNSPGRLSKLLILDSNPPTPPQYIIDGGNPVLRLNFIFDPSVDLDIYVDGALWDKKSTMQTFNITEFRKEDEVVWGFMPAVYWANNESYGVGLTELRKVGNSLYVSVRVPYEWLQAAVYPVYIDPTLEPQVDANLDDVHEATLDGTVADHASYIIHLSGGDTARQHGAHRWVSGSLPVQGDTIDVCYLEVYVAATNVDDARQDWYFEDTASPVQFTTDDYDVTGRTPTTASVAWSEVGVGAGWQQSPSLVTPLQEVIDDYSPTAIVALGISQISAAKLFYTRSHNYDTSLAAKLHIEWTGAAAGYPYSFGTIIG